MDNVDVIIKVMAKSLKEEENIKAHICSRKYDGLAFIEGIKLPTIKLTSTQ